MPKPTFKHLLIKNAKEEKKKKKKIPNILNFEIFFEVLKKVLTHVNLSVTLKL